MPVRECPKWRKTMIIYATNVRPKCVAKTMQKWWPLTHQSWWCNCCRRVILAPSISSVHDWKAASIQHTASFLVSYTYKLHPAFISTCGKSHRWTNVVSLAIILYHYHVRFNSSFGGAFWLSKVVIRWISFSTCLWRYGTGFSRPDAFVGAKNTPQWHKFVKYDWLPKHHVTNELRPLNYGAI